jgi:DNA end-binding protein Ku
MKSIWNGIISFGLVHIPVRVYSATKAREVHLPYLHTEDLGRITMERICKRCGQPLRHDELVRGYEYEKGKYVPLTEEDFEQLAREALKSITITEFVDPRDIDLRLFEKPYYLAPDENGEELYVLLREALKRTRKAGIGKLVWYGREHLVAITATEHLLMLHILYFADEIAPPQELTFLDKSIAVGEEEMALAERLVESMGDRFTPERYKDTFQENLRELIEKKRAEVALASRPARRSPTQVADLLAKLRESVERAERERGKKVAA